MDLIRSLGVVGAGAWGTALAINAARAGLEVKLWGRDSKAMSTLSRERVNARYLPGIRIDPAIDICTELEALSDMEALLLVVPAQTIGDLVKKLPSGEQPFVICAKGLDRGTDKRLSEVVGTLSPNRPLLVLSGPNFASEVANGLPAAATLGSVLESLGRSFAASISHDQFRLYWTDDVIGVEIGGAVKNVLAIAAGIVAGLGLGENAKAALITRGLAELMRLGDALGARRETLMGLAGLGDLLLTAGSLTSRNMAFGYAIGGGASPVQLQNDAGALVEGALTAKAVVRMADRCQRVDVPICRAVDAILDGKLGVDEAVDALMTRPLRAENDQ